MAKYEWSEVFISIEGEGPHSGKPTVYVRFVKCNFQCRGFNNPENLELTNEVLGFDPADYNSNDKINHNDFFTVAINKYVDNKSEEEIKKELNIFSDKNKKIIYSKIKSIDPKSKVKTGLEAQKKLGVRKQCKEWVDFIAKKKCATSSCLSHI